MNKKKPKLTAKQAKFVQGIAEGKSGAQAALAAYDTTDYNSANQIAVENLQKPTVKEALAPILAKHQIDLDRAIAPIGEALQAEKVVIVGKGDDAFADVTPDHSVRLQASDRALKLLGVNQDNTGNTYNFVQVVQEQRDKYGI